MDDSKAEVNLNLCRGCLSSDRMLLPLKQNFDLYTLILNDGMIYNDLKYFNTYFCWECTALLRRMKEFQKRIQKAQLYFDQFVSENETLLTQECLSTLKVVNNNSVQYFNYTELLTDLKTEALLKCDNPDIEHIECTVKEENFDDLDYDNDIPSSNDDDFIPKKINKTEIKVESNLTNKDEDSKRTSRMTKVEFQVDSDEKAEMCTFSLKEVEAMRRCKNSTWKTEGFNNRANFYFRHLQSLRKKDELRSCNTADTNITCSSCKSSVRTTEISQHWDAHIITLYKCKYCPYYGRTIGETEHHFRSHTIMYKCNECGLQYCTKKESTSHYKNMHEVAVCDYCGVKFRYKRSIERHIKIHHTPCRCDKCNRFYKNYRLLQKHKLDVHPTAKGEMFYCVECNVHFKSAARYNYHLMMTKIHGNKPVEKYPCPECAKEFASKYSMDSHYRLTHQNKTKYHCETCDKYFFSLCSLKYHRNRVHLKIANPKDKLCTFCGRGFSENRTLIQHIRTHTGERPYKCSVCNAGFAQKYPMLQHERKQHNKYR